MNTKLQLFFARRSIRKYTDQPVPDSALNDLLQAAMAAPSAAAKDPWHFIVIKEKNTLMRVAEALPNGKMLADAGAGIVVCGDIKQAHGQETSYMLQDCAAAIQNILLAACALGLGSCWLGVHPRAERMEQLRKIFDLPAHIIPVSAIAVGSPAEHKEPATRYQNSAVHWECWGQTT